jgi:cellulose synthase/poly-beta-1,6-N-acetylglucosamine synthase-like glycosyltransferase
VDEARGEYLAFTDDDCCPAPDWLSRLAARFALTPDRAIGGRTINALPANLYSTASQMLISYLYSYYNADPEQAQFLATNNLAIPAALLRTAGGLNPTYTRAAAEDRDLCDRWLQRGWGLTYAPEAVIYHAHFLTLRTFLRQHLQYGRGAFQYRLARAARHRGPVRIEPPRFYANLLSYPFTQDESHPTALLAALLALSQVANAAGFFAEWLVPKPVAGRQEGESR